MSLSLNDAPRRLLLLIALGFVLSLSLATRTYAQGFGGPPSPEEMKARMAAQTDDVIKQLELTKAEEAKVRPILEERNEKRLALFNKAQENRSRETMMAMRKDMEALDEATGKKLAGVLTEAQMAKYQKIQEENAARRRDRRGQ